LSGEAAQAAAANRSLKPGDDEETDAIQASPSSLPDLTRQSIILRRWMDARVVRHEDGASRLLPAHAQYTRAFGGMYCTSLVMV
jgi:hypothetical protein